MIKQSFAFPIKLLLWLAGIMLIGYAIYSQFANPKTVAPSAANTDLAAASSKALAQREDVNNLRASPNISLVSTQNPAAIVTTYQPGLLRAQRRIADTMSNMKQDGSKKSWWLYAQSEKDAQWLDHYGYPTPAEHDHLMSASDAELDVLAKNGDLNAKSHIASREAKNALTSGSGKDAVNAQAEFMDSLYGGGPYQAVMAKLAFVNIARDFQRLPPAEQTDERRALVQRLSDVQIRADVINRLYGDDLGRGAARFWSSESKSQYLGLKAQPEISGDAALAIINYGNREREFKGLPPLTIIPRPLEPDEKDKVVIERY